MHTIDKPKIVVFHPYMALPDTPAASEHLTYRGQTGTFSVIWHASAPDGTPIDPEFRVHDELTPGGHPVSGAPGAAGADGADGVDGADGSPGMSAYQLAVANGFVGNLAAWLLSLVGPEGDPGADGVSPVPVFDGTQLSFEDAGGAVLAGPVDLRGAAGISPVPVWTGTQLAWEAPPGTQIAAPVDLVGPAGANGSVVWVSGHPTLTGVQVLHIIPPGSAVGTPPQTYNIGMDEIDDFEHDVPNKRLRITTKAGNEFEVDVDFVDLAQMNAAIATALAPYLLSVAVTGPLTGNGTPGSPLTVNLTGYLSAAVHDAGLVDILGNDGVTLLFRAHA